MGDQIAIQLLRKEKSNPLKSRLVPVPKAIGQAGKADLENGYLDALESGNPELITQYISELNREHLTRARREAILQKFSLNTCLPN